MCRKGGSMESNRQWRKNGLQDMPLSLFHTGYVIEMECGSYFAGWNDGKICCLPAERAEYFRTVDEAEHYVRRMLGFPGLRVHICCVCWTLVETESLEDEWRIVTGKNGKAVKFSTYPEAEKYQREQSLQKDSMIEIYVFREKEMLLAA